MKQYWKPIVTLLVLSTLLTEVLSGNLPIAALAQPFTVFLFVTIGYGFPILVLREIWIRKQLGLVQLFLLGIGYGIYNEGLYARTIFDPYHSPVDVMATYGLVGDVRVPWLLSIGSWHALFAVVFTLIIVHRLFPRDAAKSWISAKTAWILGLLGVAVGVWQFLHLASPEQFSLSVQQVIFMFICGGVLWSVAMLLPARPVITATFGKASWRYFFVGMGLFLLLYLVPVVIVGLHVPVSMFFVYFATVALLFGYAALRRKTITLSEAWHVALGGEVACASTVLVLASFSGNTVLMTTSAIFVCVFLFLALRRNA